MAPALIALHGFTHTGRSWDPAIAALGERYRAIAPDIRGHGRQSERRPVTLEAVLEDIAALAPERFTLAGYSMGGRLALHAALALPERIERLVLVGASPGIADPRERAARRAADEELADRLETRTIDEFAREWARTPMLAGLAPDVLAEVHADRLRSTVTGLAGALRGLGAGSLPSLWDRLGELTMPVALVVGERDVKFRHTAEQMLARMPTARLHTMTGAGHAVHLESPESVACTIVIGPGRPQN
jgi:2-succinyl-6-hydroxy-2,4-cyclohexadiene-1-carboxylate synthase